MHILGLKYVCQKQHAFALCHMLMFTYICVLFTECFTGHISNVVFFSLIFLCLHAYGCAHVQAKQLEATEADLQRRDVFYRDQVARLEARVRTAP